MIRAVEGGVGLLVRIAPQCPSTYKETMADFGVYIGILNKVLIKILLFAKVLPKENPSQMEEEWASLISRLKYNPEKWKSSILGNL